MSEGLNRVMLMGNLGADPELRYTQSGHAVLNMRLATTESYVDRDGQRKDRTEWHNVVLWGKRAEALSRYLNKGSSIFVEGSIRYSSYEGQDGQKRYKTEVNARNVLFTGSKGGGGGEGARGQEQGQAPGWAQDGGGGSGSNDDDDDDLPF